jgi:serine/threonine protein kinase
MTGEGILEWRDRLSLTVGAATGLEYLHNGSDPKIIHRDVKSSNILISSENVAKVSDFGLSKLIADLDKTHVTTAVKGTAGYLDPEYFTSQQLTEKSDVYSFGVVLMEILFAREPISGNYGPEAYNLTAWARPILQQMIPKGDYSTLDPSLESHFNPKSLEIVTSLAVRCTHQHGMKRPTMAEVLRELKLALAIEEGGASFEMPSFKQSPKISEDMHFTAPTPR